MRRERVSSSTVASIGYDEASEIVEVEFVNGSIYQYYSVPASVFEQFRTAPSVGKFLNAVIRKAYRYSRVG